MTSAGAWVTRGFEAFRKGAFGNAGHNIYVSKAGVLQRIHHFGLHRNGYVDLIFCNSQSHCEKPPAYLYLSPLDSPRRIELPANAALAGTVADLNGDGFDDVVLGMAYNGVRRDLNACIYYGAPEGPSERRMQLLPAPMCSAVAAGDFNGDGRPDLAFLCEGRLRLFFQSELGFEPKRFCDLDISGEQLDAGDLDGDGLADLVVRARDGSIRIYWASSQGIQPEQFTAVTVPVPPAPPAEKDAYVGWYNTPCVQTRILRIGGMPHVFVAMPEQVFLVPVGSDRRAGEPIVLSCRSAKAAAVGDFNGDGWPDIALACRDKHGAGECSWIYWGGARGFNETNRTPLPSHNASDVAAGDLDGNGLHDLILAQASAEESFTAPTLVYRGTRQGIAPEPVLLSGEDTRRVFIARTLASPRPQVFLVNHHCGERLGNTRVPIYSGGPDGFSPERRLEVPGWGAVEALYCDVNDDGWPDLILANCSENSIEHDPGSYIFHNGPAGLAHEPSARLPTQRTMGICCADINRDGYLELIAAGFHNPDILIFQGTPQGFAAAHPQRLHMEYEGQPCQELRVIGLADLNNDGWLDLFVPDLGRDRSLILWGGPDGFSLERAQFLSVWHACCARAADLTGNGYLDLIVGGHMPSRTGPHDSWVYIYWNGPDGLREDRRTLLPANAVNYLAVADFNNDGLLDLFVGSYHGVLEREMDSYIYWNRRGRGFSAEDRARLFTHSASGCIAADFNRDGWVDLAIAYHKVNGDHRGHSAVWWNGPDGFDEKRVTRLPTSGPHGMISVEPGNLTDRGPEEYYVSAPFQLPAGRSARRIHWQADLLPETWVRAQLRFAGTCAALETAPWCGPNDAAGDFNNGDNVPGSNYPGAWIQYRLALGARNGCSSPRVTQVSVDYA